MTTQDDGFVKISAPSGSSYDCDITYGGKHLTGVAAVDLKMRPGELNQANLTVYTSLCDVKALARMFPTWEEISDRSPAEGQQCLFLLSTGKYAVGAIDDAPTATKFIPLDWLKVVD